MRKVREVLRLRHALGLSYREISEALRVGKTSVGEFVHRAEVIGITCRCRGSSTMASLSVGCSRPPARRRRSARLRTGQAA
jgi:hypothetical protein